MKKFEESPVEYSIARLFFDDVWDANAIQKIHKIEKKRERNYMQLCLAVYYESNKNLERAYDIYEELYEEVDGNPILQRFCVWAMEEKNS